MRSRIWTVTDDNQRSTLGFFSTQLDANAYCNTLVERYALGSRLSLDGRHLAPDAGNWKLGLGPSVKDQPLDEPLDYLPGSWMVKVDETCRMTACSFNTIHRPGQAPIHYRTGIHAICEAYAATPHDALDRARKAMVSYLGKNHSWR